MSVHIDASELDKLVADLGRVEVETPVKVRAVVQKGALNIKNDWKRNWSGIGHAPHIPNAITFDARVTRSMVEAEIGPDKARTQGALGNILEFGTSKNAPLAGGGPALDREGPRFVEALADVLGDIL